MNPRKLAGAVLAVSGAGLMVLGFFNLNNLLFVSAFVGWENVPMYTATVMVPALVGVLLLIDAMCVMSRGRRASMTLYLAANFLWGFTILELSEKLSVPLTDPASYQIPAVTLFASFLCLIVGGLASTLSRAEPKQLPALKAVSGDETARITMD